jgi:hypothetical protein
MNCASIILESYNKMRSFFSLYNAIRLPHYIMILKIRHFPISFFYSFSDYIYNIYNDSCNNLTIITLTATNFFKRRNFYV